MPKAHRLPRPVCMQAVPYDLSLAAVKKYIWKKGDDLVFHFKARDARQLAPLPAFNT